MVQGDAKTRLEDSIMERPKWARMTAAVLAAGAACAEASDFSFRTSATPGVRHYRYQSVERAQGQPDKRYRVDFDLVTGPDGSVTALLLKAESASGDTWSTPSVDKDCRQALHARGRELARITLAPLSPEAATLGVEFMAMCAPAAYFFPITDILNVSLIQTQPKFHLDDLSAMGASARFEGFDVKFERLGVAIAASSPGGEIRLSALDAKLMTVDWSPDPMQIQIIHRKAEETPEVSLSGVEHYAFRVEIDSTSGALKRATTTADNLDLMVAVPGLSPDKAPRLKIVRDVSIEQQD